MTYELNEMLRLIVVAAVEVLFAMLLDLCSGLYKAKLRGELRKSDALKRTIYKFLVYEGALLTAAGMDILIRASQLFAHIGFEWLSVVPVITFCVALFLSVVEIMSIKEHADEKMHSEINRAAQLTDKVTQKLLDALVDGVAERLRATASGTKTTQNNESA